LRELLNKKFSIAIYLKLLSSSTCWPHKTNFNFNFN